jgi:hypothetical protein
MTFLMACGGGDNNKKDALTVVVAPSSANLHLGESVSFWVVNGNFTWAVTPSNGHGCVLTGSYLI